MPLKSSVAETGNIAQLILISTSDWAKAVAQYEAVMFARSGFLDFWGRRPTSSAGSYAVPTVLTTLTSAEPARAKLRFTLWISKLDKKRLSQAKQAKFFSR
jgi:hypothetical protein